MDGVLTQKTISFLGSWKCNRVSDHLLNEIATHSNKIKGNTTKLQVSKIGINLIAVDGSGQLGKSTLIPLSNIYNVTVNRFKPECLLCVVRDEPNKLSVLVCRCKTEKDIPDIIQSFNTVKSSQTGEGFNTNIKKSSGQNWSLNSRQGVDEENVVHFPSTEKPNIVITQNGNQSLQSGTTVSVFQKDNRNFIDTAVQTETEEELDSASSMSSATVKEELLHLSQDVRAIKRMLEMSAGISDSQHFKRTSQMSKYGQQIQYEEVPVFYSQDQVLRTSREGKMKGGDTVIKGRSTKIIPDHDIRSFAVQTDHRYQNNLSPGEVSAFSYGNAQYIQRPIGSSVSSTSSPVPEVYTRQRIGSHSSTNSDAVFLQYQSSPGIVGEHDKIGKISYFITPPPGKGDKSHKYQSLHVRHYSQKDQRSPPAVLSTTIPRSIENVYSGKRYRKNQDKTRVVVTPRTFVNGEIHRKTSDSEKRAVVKGDRTLLRTTKSGSDTSLGENGNSLREIKLGEVSDHGQLHHSKDLQMQQLSNSQEIPKIVDFVENDNEKINRDTMTKIESYNNAPQTQKMVIVENIIQSDESNEKVHTNGELTEQGRKTYESGDRSIVKFDTTRKVEQFDGNSVEANNVLASEGFHESDTVSSTVIPRETFNRSVEYNSDKTLESLEFDNTANRDSLEQDTASNRDSFDIVTAPTRDSIGKSRNGSNSVSFKEPEVFVITSEELDNVSKSPTFGSEKQETSFVFEQKNELENVSKSPDFAAKQPEYSFDFEKRASVFRNADVKTTKTKTKNTEEFRRKTKPPEEIREKPIKQPEVYKKEPEVFYITDDDLESACKIPNIPREYYEVDSVAEDQNSSIPDIPKFAESIDTYTPSTNQELSTEVTRDDDEPADDRKTHNETS